jgi:hypothetical protein
MAKRGLLNWLRLEPSGRCNIPLQVLTGYSDCVREPKRETQRDSHFGTL